MSPEIWIGGATLLVTALGVALAALRVRSKRAVAHAEATGNGHVVALGHSVGPLNIVQGTGNTVSNSMHYGGGRAVSSMSSEEIKSEALRCLHAGGKLGEAVFLAKILASLKKDHDAERWLAWELTGYSQHPGEKSGDLLAAAPYRWVEVDVLTPVGKVRLPTFVGPPIRRIKEWITECRSRPGELPHEDLPVSTLFPGGMGTARIPPWTPVKVVYTRENLNQITEGLRTKLDSWLSVQTVSRGRPDYS